MLDPQIGHNSDENGHDSDTVLTQAAQGRLRTIVERLERLEEDRKAVVNDFREVLMEAKGDGWDPKIIRKVLKLRAMDAAKRIEEEALIELYLSAIGGL